MPCQRQNESPNERDPREIASTSRSLVDRLKQRDAESWNRLVTLYAPLVYYWCGKLGVQAQDSADVVQEVFQAVAKSIQKFQCDKPENTFRGWLRTITRSKAINAFRHQSRQPAKASGGSEALGQMHQVPDYNSLDDSHQTDDAPATQALFLRACKLVQQDFQENTWKAFWLVVIEGRSPSEVAEELSMRSGTVRVAKCRVLQRLRQELGESFDSI